jgi:hypothetical protein
MFQRHRSLIEVLQNPEKWDVPWLQVRRVEPVTGRYVHATVLYESRNLYLCFTLKDRAVTPQQVINEGWELDPRRRRAA